MGSFFTSVCMQASKTAAKNALRSAMKARGYRTDNKTAEISFSIVPCGSKWYCLKSDQMDFDDFDAFIADFAAQLNVPVLAANCIDSDFIYLNLYKNGETDCTCVGKPYDEEPPIPRREFWQDIISDFNTFTGILSQDYVFAEEALVPLGKLMGFDGAALLPSDEPAEGSITMGFSRTGVKEKPLISIGPTILGHAIRQKAQPYHLDTHSTIAMHNFGGPSKGIDVVIEAVFANRNDSPFEICDAQLRDMRFMVTFEAGQSMHAEFECIYRDGGRSCWHATFPDFQIPEGINRNYKYPSMKQQMHSEFAQEVLFHYCLRIPEHLSELYIRFTPMEYPDGSYIWRLEDCWISPQELEIFDREGSDAFHEYMQKKHKQEGNPS